MSSSSSSPNRVVEVTGSDLLGSGVVTCPNPRQVLWSSHPKVYIDVVSEVGGAACPYCGTVYRLKPGETAAHSH